MSHYPLLSETDAYNGIVQTALVPNAETLRRFSIHLLKTRPKPKLEVAFPGSPRPSDFDVIEIDPLNLPESCPLTKEDLVALKELKDDLFRVCERARQRGVRILIDAEHRCVINRISP